MIVIVIIMWMIRCMGESDICLILSGLKVIVIAG